MKQRFFVKPVTIVFRNSMIAGNPVERSEKRFGVYDREWKNDPNCQCPKNCGEIKALLGARKYRVVVEDEQLAKDIAKKLNALLQLVPNAKTISFNGLDYWTESADKISICSVSC